MRRGVAVAVGMVLSSALAFTQAPDEAPKPGPEHGKLGYFVGKWTSQGETKPNPFMPTGKFTTNDTCEWFEGGFAVICRSEGNGPMGPTKQLGILSYSAEKKTYTYYGVDNSPMTMASVALGTVHGNTWLYKDETRMAGKTVKSRYMMEEISPTSYTFRWEILGEDENWQTVMEGKAKKAS